MPLMMVWPVSGSVATRKVGSSCASFWSARPSFSWSALVLGSIATSMTGSGKIDRLEHDRDGLRSQSVSPVVDGLQPGAAHDIAGQDFLDLFALVGVHLQQAADPLPVALGDVVHDLRPAASLPE